ncbi:MAG: hypothetical protein R2824_10575 [Saprospiraceae bacterium]
MNRWLLVFALYIGLVSCQSEPKTRKVYCGKDLSSYPIFDYETSKKKFLRNTSSDSLYSANVLILINKAKRSLIHTDSLYMYSLAIANHENLVRARFFTGRASYEIANKLNLNRFDLEGMREEIDNSEYRDLLFDKFLGGLIISGDDTNWREQLHSDNIFTGGFKQIAPINGEFVREIYVLEK